MSEQNNVQIEEQLKELYKDFAAGHVSRRDFMRRATAMGVAGAAAAALGSLAAPAEAADWRSRQPPRRPRFRSTSPSGATCGST